MAKSKTPDPLIGQKIVAVRHATKQEAEDFGFEYDARRPLAVIVLENNKLICPSRDAEGNGPGVFFTLAPNGDCSRIG